MKRRHVMPFGAELLPEGGVRFRLWAPSAQRVELVLQQPSGHVVNPMAVQEGGWYERIEPSAHAGTRYFYRIDSEIDVPDPASRGNPTGVHAASEVVDPHGFEWADSDWRGRDWDEAVLYELHVGTFTPQGTFAGVEEKLDDLAALGVTGIELMPIGAFAGERGWGYDGVLPFAPYSGYGKPDDLKRLVQAAHARGLMVFLDVVYNHFGPDGNYIRRYAQQFFTDRYQTPWGSAINFDGAESGPVRDFFLHNALYWLEEFHLDGLRLDAVHEIRDAGGTHLVHELAEAVTVAIGETRKVHLVLENHDNTARLIGGAGRARAQWNDDFHHVMHVLATGETASYYSDFAEHPIARAGRALAEGFVYQGEASAFEHGKARGEPSRQLPTGSFVNFLQNHDQIGNRAFGERLGALAPPGRLRAIQAITLLAPSPPMLFMGEEYGAPQPFLYFCDFQGDLARAVTEGRRREFAGFAAFSDAAAREHIPDPGDAETFSRCVLQWSDREQPPHREQMEYIRRLLQLRREKIVPLLPRLAAAEATFEVQGSQGLSVTWPLWSGGTLRLLANLGDTAQKLEGAQSAGTPIFSTGVDKEAIRGESFDPWEVRWYRTES